VVLELVVAFAAGALLTWLLLRQREARKVAEATSDALARAAAAEARLAAAADRDAVIVRAEQQLREPRPKPSRPTRNRS
jgi:hypothetical protein